jgi:hypothetical protein
VENERCFPTKLVRAVAPSNRGCTTSIPGPHASFHSSRQPPTALAVAGADQQADPIESMLQPMPIDTEHRPQQQQKKCATCRRKKRDCTHMNATERAAQPVVVGASPLASGSSAAGAVANDTAESGVAPGGAAATPIAIDAAFTFAEPGIGAAASTPVEPGVGAGAAASTPAAAGRGACTSASGDSAQQRTRRPTRPQLRYDDEYGASVQQRATGKHTVVRAGAGEARDCRGCTVLIQYRIAQIVYSCVYCTSVPASVTPCALCFILFILYVPLLRCMLVLSHEWTPHT